MLIKATIGEVRAVIAAVNDIRRFIRERSERSANALTGLWTNEGDVIGPIPSHYIDLELLVEDSKVSGIVRSNATRGRTSLPNGSLLGRKRWGKIVGEIVDVRRGHVVKFGDITLQLKGEKLLWSAESIQGGVLPESATLLKFEEADEDDEDD